MAPYTLSKTLLTAAGILYVGFTALASASVNSSHNAHDHAALEMHGHMHYESHGQMIPHLEARATIGQAVLGGVNLRILPLGDSITWGYASPDGNGYRLKLSDDTRANDLVFAGTLQSGTMKDNWNSGFSGKTIQYIAGQAAGGLSQNPNIVLLLAGTNDMNPNPATSKEGTNANDAAGRLGSLVDKILNTVSGTTVLVGKIPQAADPTQNANIKAYNALIPGVVSSRASAGKQVRLVDFSVIGADLLIDGIHPTEAGYQKMGDIWFQAIAAIPSGWVKKPIGDDPKHLLNCGGSNALSPINGGASVTGAKGDLSANGGPDPNIPAPVFHHGKLACEIALGLGHPGDWKYKKAWVSGGQVVSGLHLDMPGVELFDMDGDGKAEYLWINEKTGQLTCWINNYPNLWHPCGNNNGIIASGACPRDNVFLADMNGDGKTDYLCVDGDTGKVTVYWNEGPDANFVNGWRFTPGGVIATGVPHANLRTLRFADMDGDGRADYVYIGKGGSLGLYLNTGTQGGHDVLFLNQGGIATGASSNIDNIVLSDINGDGRADYLIWDDIAGLSGYLNIRTRDQGTPFFAAQGGLKSIADGISQDPASIRLADIDGDGLNDYCYIDSVGALWIWYNGGGPTDASVDGDGVRLADMDGDHIDDYIWLDEATGAPTVYLNKGPKAGAPDNWFFAPQNGGKPIASGAGPREQVHFGDIDGDNRTDYLVLDPKTGAVNAYLNGGYKAGHINSWIWNPVGQIASGLGPGENARFADIDGDGKADYIELSLGGKAIVWKNNYPKAWSPLAAANAAGINRPPAEITFADMDGDGKADYIWTDPISGQPKVWYNRYPATVTWQVGNYLSVSRDGVSGPSIQYARLQKGGQAVPVFVNPDNGAIAAFVNGCSPTGAKRSLQEPVFHPKRELRKRDHCGTTGENDPVTDSHPPINGCPAKKPYDPFGPFGPSPCSNGTWLGIQCDNPDLQNSGNHLKYFAADSVDAFANVMAWWNNYLDYTKINSGYTPWTFPVAASNYFHGPGNFHCEQVESADTCAGGSIVCSTQSPNSPAGSMILNSLTVLHTFGNTISTVLIDSIQDVQLKLKDFSSTFAKTANTQQTNLAIDALIFGATLGVAGGFTGIVRGIRDASSTFGERGYEITQNFALAAVGSVNGFAHDALSDTATTDDVNDALTDYLGTLKTSFQTTNRNFFQHLLDPRDDTNKNLLKSYMNAAFLTWDDTFLSYATFKASTLRALWGALLQSVWANSPQPVYPFIMAIPKSVYTSGDPTKTATGTIKGDQRPFSSIVKNGGDLLNSIYHDADYSYFLLDAGDAVDTCKHNVKIGCVTPQKYYVGVLPGGDSKTLAGGDTYGGITIQDIISSNIAGFKMNGNKNGWSPTKFNGNATDVVTFQISPADIAYGAGVNTPGFFNFPVCLSVDQFWYERDHWTGSQKPTQYDPHFPCGLTGLYTHAGE